MSKVISKNREVSNSMREEIRKYSLAFDWKNVVENLYVPKVESIIGGI